MRVDLSAASVASGESSAREKSAVESVARFATFSCEDTGPIAKCVYAGYKPWKTWSRSYWRLPMAHSAVCTSRPSPRPR